MTQTINYHALNEFLEHQSDDTSSIYLWYEKLSEYDLDGNESPREIETLFEAMKFLMSFSFTAAEELREVAEREAVQMAEKEEAWEEQKIALKEELDTLRERITLSADAGDSSEAFRAQINSLREENRELEKTNRDRDREMADLRDRFESLVARADVLTRERDALELHRNQMEDTIRELQRRISAKSEEGTNEWESRKLRQRNEQAVTLTRQMQAVVLQNEELREEVTRVGDALEEATKVINDSALRYAELTTLYDAARRELKTTREENEVMRQNLETSASMLVAAESEAIDNEQSTTSKMREMSDTNAELRKELYATKRELESLRQMADSMDNKEKEVELDKLRTELMEATKTAQSLCGELTSKSSSDPTVALRLRIMQLEKNFEQETQKLTSQKKTLKDLEDALANKDEVNSELAAELERLKELKFGSAREELQRLTTQLSFRDAQIAKLSNHCTMLQIELGNYAERGMRPPSLPVPTSVNVQETQTENGDKPDVIPRIARQSAGTEERKRRKPSRQKEGADSGVESSKPQSSKPKEYREFNEDVWEEQAMLIVSLYSELMLIMEEQELKAKQIADMELTLSNGRRAVDDVKSKLKKAYEEIYILKMNESSGIQKNNDHLIPEITELRRFAKTIRMGGTEMERRAEETTRKLIAEQIERIRLSHSNTLLRRRCNRVERGMRRARERMLLVETQAGRRCAQLQYQLDMTLIELASCQNKLVESVPVEAYQKLAIRVKKENVAEVLGGDAIEETWTNNHVSIASPTDEKVQELEAKNVYLKKIVEVISEQNDFWSKETEILQNENEELKRFVEEMENDSDAKNILVSIEQRLLETIREQQEDQRDHERAYRKATEAEEKLAHSYAEWAGQRARLVFAVRTLQIALSNSHLNSLNGLSLQQVEKLKTKIQETWEKELLVNETKQEVETLRDELRQQLVAQKSALKANEDVKNDDTASKLERKLQVAYSSLELQTMAADRLKNTMALKDRQMYTMNEEIEELRKENENLLTTIASCNLLKTTTRVDDSNGLDATMDHVEIPRAPLIDEQSNSREDSEGSSNDTARVVVKTILYDNSKEFEKRLAKMKEAADVCIQSYKKQLQQKDEALKVYQQFAERKLSTSSRPIVEKEIIREEIRVADEQTEAQLRQAFGDVARLKENLEEVEKANRALYRKRRRSIIPIQNTVECQTDMPPDDELREDSESKIKKTSSRNLPSGSTKSNIATSLDFEKNTFETERTRYKNEIKQLQARLRRMTANNKDLIHTCEKIRDDTLATLETRTTTVKNTNEETLLKIRTELEKTRKENRALQKTIDEQKRSVEDLKVMVDKKRNADVEISMWNERKKIEESLSSAKKKLAAAIEREKDALERLGKRERVFEELKRDEEARQKELDRALRRNAQLLHERDKAVRENKEVELLKQRLQSDAEELASKTQEISTLSSRLKSVQHDYLQIVKEFNVFKEESTKQSKHDTSVPNISSQVMGMNDSVRVQESMTEHPKVTVAVDEIAVLQLKETKKQLRRAEIQLSELNEKLINCEKERQRLSNANEQLLAKIDRENNGPLGAVSVLSDKLQAKDKAILELVS